MARWRRPMLYVLDGEGNAQACDSSSVDDLARWAEAQAQRFEHPLARVGSDTIGDVWISTVFLGSDLAVVGPPMLWETAVFAGRRDVAIFARYARRDEALAGHAVAVELAQVDPTCFWGGDEAESDDD